MNKRRLIVMAGLVAGLALFTLNAVPVAPAYAGGCGPTVKETLTGSAINGVVPEGQAQADESQFLCGGDTILTVQVKNVNLPDGTVLGVSLDFTPVGTITLSKQEGSMSADLGHFAVSHDNVRVNNGGTTILIGGSFQ